MDNDFRQNPAKTGQKADLKPSQERAITALLQSPTIVAAARKAEVGERTLRRWLREDELFQTTLRQLRQEALSHAATRLQQGASCAVESMLDLITSDKRIETGRASMVRTFLDFAFRSGAYSDLAERIAALEKAPAPKDDK